MKLLRTPVAVLMLAASAALGMGTVSLAQEPSGARPTGAASSRVLPKDVYPESLNRLPLIKRDDLDERGKKVYDNYANPNSRSLAGLQGPGGIRLYSPRLAEFNEPLNEYLRYDTGISRRLSELAILVVAREFDSQFEWSAHEPTGIKEGLEPSIIDVVKYRKDVKGLPETEAVIITLGRELLRTRNLSSPTYARALKIFGNKGMVDLVSLMTNYVSTSFFLRAFDMQLHDDQKPLLPML